MTELVVRVIVATVRDVLPVAVIIIGFQVLVLRQPLRNPRRVAIGLVYVVLGLALFLLGLEEALFPIGRTMAEQLTAPGFVATSGFESGSVPHWLDFYWVYLFAFAIGFSTTLAEPALIAVAIKAREVSGGTVHVSQLRIAVALGVAVGITLGAYRIVVGHPIHLYMVAGYLLVVLQTWFAPREIIPLAYDSGGVTTSTVTVPLVAALGLGLAETVPGRNPIVDGFGLIAFASLFPIVAVIAYAQLAAWAGRRRQRPEGKGPRQRRRA